MFYQGMAMEGMVRTLLARPDPPAVVFMNHFSYRDWNCKRECGFSESCDAGLGEIARSYHVGTGARAGGPYLTRPKPQPLVSLQPQPLPCLTLPCSFGARRALSRRFAI